MKKKYIIFLVILIIVVTISGLTVLKEKTDKSNPQNLENNKVQAVENSLKSHEKEIGSIENLIYESNYNNNYKYTQTFKGIEVFGGGIVATVKNNEASNIINYNYQIPENFNITLSNNKEDLLEIAKKQLSDTNATLKESKLIIYPINKNEFTLAYLFEFNVGSVIVSDTDKKVLATSTIINGNDILNKSIKQQIDENYNEVIKNIEKEIEPFKQSDGSYSLVDNERNIEFYRIKDDYKTIPDYEFLEKDTQYYERITWNNKSEAISDDIYYAIKAMQQLQKVHDFYNKEFSHMSIKENEDYTLRVFTNTSIISDKIFTNNAALFFFNENDIRIYYGSTNEHNEDLETAAHEYTHGYFNRIVKRFSDTETNAINEAYSDIMGMIIEAYYENENKQIDGISGENASKNFRRDIQNSNLKLTDFNEKMESHEASMIVSKVAYLMFTNENLNMDINKLSQLWFNAIYKLPNHIVDFEDVERAILLQAVELGYSESEIREMTDIFVSLGYPDYFDECTGKKIINTRKIQNLEMKEAVQLLQNNFGDWRGIKVNFEYVTTVVDDNRNVYYVINAFAEENFMYSGGEWLAEITDGKYYAGTYYVRNYYVSDIVFAGQNPRDYGKYEYGDTIDGIFINRYYININ